MSIGPDSYNPERQTLPSMGGLSGGSDRHSRAAAALLTRRGDVDIDPQLSAAIERGKEQSAPRTVRLSGSGAANAAGVAIFGMGGPKAGFVWDIRRVNIGPADYSAGSFPSPTAVIAVIAPGGVIGTPADSAGEVISLTTIYPAEATWGRGEATLLAHEHLKIIVTGLTQGTVVTGGGQATETAAGWPETYGQ